MDTELDFGGGGGMGNLINFIVFSCEKCINTIACYMKHCHWGNTPDLP